MKGFGGEVACKQQRKRKLKDNQIGKCFAFFRSFWLENLKKSILVTWTSWVVNILIMEIENYSQRCHSKNIPLSPCWESPWGDNYTSQSIDVRCHQITQKLHRFQKKLRVITWSRYFSIPSARRLLCSRQELVPQSCSENEVDMKQATGKTQ